MPHLPILIATILKHPGSSNVSLDALSCLKDYTFPGNIRELRNIVERSVLLADDGTVHLSHLPRQCQKDHPIVTITDADEIVSLKDAKSRYLQRVLRMHQAPRTVLAELLGVGERVLYRKLANLREP